MATDIIIGQLLENAFKYSPDGRAVTVAAQVDGDAIEVTISDEGIGIPPADRERVFERFVQGEAGDRRRFGGIGLGLYIVRQLAQAQGGVITAESRDGPGTTMRLRLRAASTDSADLSVSHPHADIPAGNTPSADEARAAEIRP